MEFVVGKNGKPVERKQGDVNLFEIVEIPDGAQEVKSRLLAEGEARGYNHKAFGRCTVLEREHNGVRQLFIRAYGKSTVEHVKGSTRTRAEHGALDLPAGNYLVGPTAEYDYDTEESRQVID